MNLLLCVIHLPQEKLYTIKYITLNGNMHKCKVCNVVLSVQTMIEDWKIFNNFVRNLEKIIFEVKNVVFIRRSTQNIKTQQHQHSLIMLKHLARHLHQSRSQQQKSTSFNVLLLYLGFQVPVKRSNEFALHQI